MLRILGPTGADVAYGQTAVLRADGEEVNPPTDARRLFRQGSARTGEVTWPADGLSSAARSEIVAYAFARGWTVEVDGTPIVPRAASHGAHGGLLAWDPDAASPRLHRIDTIGARGLLAREAWYRVADVDTSGLADAPKPGAVPVYAIEYPRWTYGTFASGMRGLTGRDRERVWYAEDGTEALRLRDDEPKPYSISTSVAAGRRRRQNVIDVRLTGIAVQSLGAIFPGEDPGPRAAALLAALDGAVRGYIATGEHLEAALNDPTTLAAFPWLGVDLAPGMTPLSLMLAEVAEPAVGNLTP